MFIFLAMLVCFSSMLLLVVTICSSLLSRSAPLCCLDLLLFVPPYYLYQPFYVHHSCYLYLLLSLSDPVCSSFFLLSLFITPRILLSCLISSSSFIVYHALRLSFLSLIYFCYSFKSVDCFSQSI